MTKKKPAKKAQRPSSSRKGPAQPLEIDGRTLKITNLEKLFFPAAGFTKGQLIDYYIRASKYVLPHLRDHPVTLKRYPDGIEGEFFYEKDAPRYTPEWVQTFPVPRRAGGTPIRYILVNDLATLVWCANIATIEFHPFLHRAPEIETPVEIVFDLDPGEGSSVLKCMEVAFILREVLDELNLKSFPKMSGSKGIQVYVPLNPSPSKSQRKSSKAKQDVIPCSYDMTLQFAKKMAQLLESQHPKLIVSEMAKELRKNKVFIDWSQNSDFKTTVGVYSMRAKGAEPFISVPVTWEELDHALTEQDSAGLHFQPGAALERFEKVGDLFEPVLTIRQSLPNEFAKFFSRRDAAVTEARTTSGSGQLAEYRRTRNSQLIRTAGAMKPVTAKNENASARTGGTMEEIASAKDAKLEFIEPMKAQLVAALPEEPGWGYEIKLDGYRAEAIRSANGVQLLSRRNNDLSRRFPRIAKACEALEPETIVDGEIVALDERGRPSFNLLQNYQTTTRPILYYVFDLLAYRGRSLLKVPLRDRRKLLESALQGVEDPVRLLGALEASPQDLVAAAKEQGIEGFVAKRLNSVYETGDRSGAWVKFKVNKSQELVIGGYMPGKDGFDSLLAGYYDRGKLQFVGKVKNGFVPRIKRELMERFHQLETGVQPFANLPEAKGARRGEAFTETAMNKARWLRPELVAQVEFTDWTEANHLRHSRFAGLRDDKDARDVVHEEPAT